MIRSFRHRGLKRFFTRSDHRAVPARHWNRIERILDRLDAAAHPRDMNLPGFDFHGLKGNRKDTYAVSITRNWRITFRFEGEDATDVDLEDYH